MRSTIKTITIALTALAALTGCGQSLTRAEWEHAHPWCKPVAEITGAPGEPTRVIYPDRLPSLTPSADGRAAVYAVTDGVHILHVRDGVVVAREWQNSQVMP